MHAYYHYYLIPISVVKQSLRCSGANVTDKHVVDISMCALFLLEAAKKCDTVFGVPPSSTAHTVRNAKSDIEKIRRHLNEKEITFEKADRPTPVFLDPTEKGLATLTNGDWLQKQLSSISDENLQDEGHGEIDIDYELEDISC